MTSSNVNPEITLVLTHQELSVLTGHIKETVTSVGDWQYAIAEEVILATLHEYFKLKLQENPTS